MKVAFVCDWLTNYSGAEHVLLAMTEVFPDAPIYTPIYNPQKTPQFANSDVRATFLDRFPKARTSWQKYLLFMPIACESIDLSEYDVVISSSHTGCSKGVITKPNCIHISYCHSPMRTVWDDYHSYIEHSSFPRFIKKLLPWPLHKMRMWDQCAAARVDHFIANSQFIANRISKYYRRESTIIHPPVHTELFTLPNTATSTQDVGDFYLIAARLVSNKRIDLVIEAFRNTDIRVKIAGRGPLMDSLKQRSTDNIKFLGYVEDDDLVTLMQTCRGFLYPQVEDFGISAIEAMACGRPVVAYDAGGAHETIIDGVTGVLFSEQTPQSLYDAVLRNEALIDTYNSTTIRSHTEQFSWKRFTDEFRVFIDECTR